MNLVNLVVIMSANAVGEFSLYLAPSPVERWGFSYMQSPL